MNLSKDELRSFIDLLEILAGEDTDEGEIEVAIKSLTHDSWWQTALIEPVGSNKEYGRLAKIRMTDLRSYILELDYIWNSFPSSTTANVTSFSSWQNSTSKTQREQYANMYFDRRTFRATRQKERIEEAEHKIERAAEEKKRAVEREHKATEMERRALESYFEPDTAKRDSKASRKISFSEIAKRITGFSTPIFGVSWEPPEFERDRARRILTIFEDQRLLLSDLQEIVDHSGYIDHALFRLRDALTEELKSLDRTSELASLISAMRAACRRCMDQLQGTKGNRSRNGNPSFIIVGELRSILGLHIAQLCTKYKLDAEEDLRLILPSVIEEDKKQD